MMSSLSEGLVLAERAGLPPTEVVKVLGLGAMANPMFALKGPKIIADEHTPNFPLKHAQKDLAFAIALADKCVLSPSIHAIHCSFILSHFLSLSHFHPPIHPPNPPPQRLGVQVKTAVAANEFYTQSLQDQEGELDFSAVAHAVQKAGGGKKP